MSTPRPSEADVEAPFDLRVAIADPGSILPRKEGETVARWSARAVLASDWLAARDAEREREVVGAAAIGRVLDLDGQVQQARLRAEAAERAIADLRGEIKALADEWEAEFLSFRHEDPAHLSIRALLPRDDAAGAGGAG